MSLTMRPIARHRRQILNLTSVTLQQTSFPRCSASHRTFIFVHDSLRAYASQPASDAALSNTTENLFESFEVIPTKAVPAPGPQNGVTKAPGTIKWFSACKFRPPLRSPLVSQERRPLQVRDGVLYVASGKHGLLPISGRLLRDVCSCAKCRNPETGQRQINVFQMDANHVQISEIDFDASDSDRVRIRFADGHEGTVSASVLAGRKTPLSTNARFGYLPITSWTADISGNPPCVHYSDVTTGDGMPALLSKVREYGFVFVDDMPATPEATEQILESIGPIRNTHYGGFYDFTSDLASKDTAYTAEALEPHTDNTYFTEPAGLQALHMLSHTNGSGGESSLVDGFAAAVQLFEEDIDAYRLLSTTGVYAHASGNDGISIQPANAFPTLSHEPLTGYLTQVRWNNADRAGTTSDYLKVDAWYEAAGKFDALLNDPKNQYWFQLRPGTMVIFDNWRVLHGRASFTGKRRMCGGYINRDDFISRFRMCTMSRDDIRTSTVTG